LALPEINSTHYTFRINNDSRMSDTYDKEYNGRIDAYRICRLYDITDPAIYHAIKKLLRSGDGIKSKREDVFGAMKSIERWIEMEQEEDSDSRENKKEMDILLSNLSGDRRDTYKMLSTLPVGDTNKILDDVSRAVGISTPKLNPGFESAKTLAKFIADVSEKVLSELQMAADSHIDNTIEKVESRADEYMQSIKEDINSFTANEFNLFLMGLSTGRDIKFDTNTRVLPWLNNLTIEEINSVRELIDRIKED